VCTKRRGVVVRGVLTGVRLCTEGLPHTLVVGLYSCVGWTVFGSPG